MASSDFSGHEFLHFCYFWTVRLGCNNLSKYTKRLLALEMKCQHRLLKINRKNNVSTTTFGKRLGHVMWIMPLVDIQQRKVDNSVIHLKQVKGTTQVWPKVVIMRQTTLQMDEKMEENAHAEQTLHRAMRALVMLRAEEEEKNSQRKQAAHNRLTEMHMCGLLWKGHHNKL